jgi:hypothetical protein
MIMDSELAKRRFERDFLPFQLNEEIYRKLGIKLEFIDFPIAEISFWWKLKQCEIRLRIYANEYDYLPPSAWWIDEKGNPLLQGSGKVPYGLGFQIENGHPHNKNQSWLCFKGWKEYHDHEGHQEISWGALRPKLAYRIPGVLVQLYSDLNKEGVNGL